MESYKYEYNEVIPDEADNSNNSTWKYFMRQFLVFSGVASIYFVLGLSFGAPTVFIDQLKKDTNRTEILTDEMSSWLSSVHGYSSIPWILILPVVSQYIGRKIPFLIVCIITTIGNIVFYCSTNAMQLLISEILQGMLLASNINLLIVTLAEYTSTQYRGVFLAIKSAIFFWGIWVANVIGVFFHWKNIGILALVCSVYPLTAFVWPESPSWLAMKGRFEECAESHHWLKGFDKDSERELVTLINSQKEYLISRAQREDSSYRNQFKSVIETLLTKSFYKPLLLCLCIMTMYHFSGKLVCGMYAIQLFNQITDSESTAYAGMLIMDGVTIVGMQIGCALAKILARRTLLLGSSILGIIFLFIISLYLYLINLGIITEAKILSVTLLTLFSVSISGGVMILPASLFAELVRLRYKGPTMLIISLHAQLVMATVLKVSPTIFKVLTLQGAFLFYGISASFFLIILYIYLPETKDKTLEEIETYFKDSCKSDRASKTLIDDHENFVKS